MSTTRPRDRKIKDANRFYVTSYVHYFAVASYLALYVQFLGDRGTCCKDNFPPQRCRQTVSEAPTATGNPT